MITSIAKIIAQPLISSITDTVVKVFSKYSDNKVSTEAIRAEVAKAVEQTVASVSVEQAKIIIAEVGADSWLTTNWRPMVAVSFSFVLLWYGFFGPMLEAWFGVPAFVVSDQDKSWVFTIVTTCLGGYIGGRSAEKVARILKGGSDDK